MSVMVKALGYYSHKGGKAAGGMTKVKLHLKYLEHGKAHGNDPVGFDRENDEVSRKDYMAQPEAQPGRGVIAHKFVISLSEQERNALGLDMKDLVRETMSSYEAQLGRQLNWIAYVHEDPGHPHAHVVVGGYAKDGKQVGFYPKDLDRLRDCANLERDRLGELNRATGLSPLERQEIRAEPVRAPKELIRESSMSLLEGVQKVIQTLLYPREPEREFQRQRERDRDR